jgi:hypothetical protein
VWWDPNNPNRVASIENTEWPVNAAGQTYGNSALADPSNSPDLMTATATNGTRGYLLKTDMDSATANDLFTSGASPATIQKWIDTVGSHDRTIPVYATDGTTVLGEYLIPAVNQETAIPTVK